MRFSLKPVDVGEHTEETWYQLLCINHQALPKYHTGGTQALCIDFLGNPRASKDTLVTCVLDCNSLQTYKT